MLEHVPASLQVEIHSSTPFEVNEDGEDVMELQNAGATVLGVRNYSVPIEITACARLKRFGRSARCGTALWSWMGSRQRRKGPGQVTPKKCRRSGNDSDDDDKDADGQGRVAALVSGGKKEKTVRKAMQPVSGQQNVGFRSAGAGAGTARSDG